MVEVGDLLTGVKILQQGRPALTDGQCVIGVVDPNPLLSRQIPGLPVDPVVVELSLFGISVVGSHRYSSRRSIGNSMRGYPRPVHPQTKGVTVTVRAAVLFDVDGTLVDSNYLHVHAWRRAFAELHIEVESWRIHRAIGMDGSLLVRLLSDDAPDDVRRQLKDLHSRYYLQSAALLSPLPGARQLLERTAALGLPVVLATSAPEDELAALRKALDCDDLIAAVTSSADVDVAKPNPDIIGVALDRIGAPADRTVLVGDAVWDAQACVRAGLPSICVLSGGVSRAELETAGAAAVFDNAEDLLAHLDQTPIAALADGRRALG